MRAFAGVLIVVGLLVAVAVPLKAEHEIAAFVASSDYTVWSALQDKVTWRPVGLRRAMYWDGWRWPSVLVGGAAVALGILVLAIRRPAAPVAVVLVALLAPACSSAVRPSSERFAAVRAQDDYAVDDRSCQYWAETVYRVAVAEARGQGTGVLGSALGGLASPAAGLAGMVAGTAIDVARRPAPAAPPFRAFQGKARYIDERYLDCMRERGYVVTER